MVVMSPLILIEINKACLESLWLCYYSIDIAFVDEKMSLGNYQRLEVDEDTIHQHEPRHDEVVEVAVDELHGMHIVNREIFCNNLLGML